MTQKFNQCFQGWKSKALLWLSFCAFLFPCLTYGVGSFPEFSIAQIKSMILALLFTIALKFIPSRFLTFSGNWSWRRSCATLLFLVLYISNRPAYWPVYLLVGLVAMPFFIGLMEFFSGLSRLVERLCSQGVTQSNRPFLHAIFAALIVLVCLLQFLQLQCSIFPDFGSWLYVRIGFLFFNLLILLALNLALLLLTRRWKIALRVVCVLCALVSVINYHVMAYHGSLLTVNEIRSALTALNVISGYSPIINISLLEILTLTLLEMRIVNMIGRLEEALNPPGSGWARANLRRLALFALNCSAIALVMVVFIDGSLVLWDAKAFMRRNGYAAIFLDDCTRLWNPYVIPEGYDAEKLDAISAALPPTPPLAPEAVAPDIIVILNETFCDISAYTDVPTDKEDYLAPFYSIENALRGHAIVPDVSTNNSEFELLTACSMSMVNNSPPFQYISFERMNNHIVQYLKRLGYFTSAMHCMTPINYNRNNAYPAMEFDDIFLGEEFFTQQFNGNRPFLDADNFQDLWNWYYNMDEAALLSAPPRFLYLLTYQNHGSWKRNDASCDTVHVQGDFGAFTSELNEYLSSVTLSATAIHELTDKLSEVKRPVILCMVGDHAPSFLWSMPSSRTRTAEETELDKRTVPYLLWSNFDADFSACTEYSNVFSLVPEVLRSAGLPLTPFYRSILDMKKEFPVYASNGVYMDADGQTGIYDPMDERFFPITQYLYMEYNALKGGEEYREELFLPPPSAP